MVVERVGRPPADHLARAAVELHPRLAADRRRRFVHERVQRQAKRRVPEPVVDELRVAQCEPGLGVGQVALADQLLDTPVGGKQEGRRRHLVDLPALDPHQAVLDRVDAPDAVRTGQRPRPPDQRHQVERLAVDRHRQSGLEGDRHLLRRGQRPVGGGGQREDVLGRRRPGILQRPGLDGAPPQVVVDRVRLAAPHRHMDPVLLGIRDLLAAGHAPVADRGQHRHVGGKRRHRRLEAHLVVPLAGAAVRDGARASLPRHRHQMTGDQRPRERRHQRVAALVEGARLQHRQHELVRELVAGVHDHRLGSARRGCPRLDLLAFDALADVDQEGDHLGAVLLGQPAQRNRCVEAARVREDDPVSHE